MHHLKRGNSLTRGAEKERVGKEIGKQRRRLRDGWCCCGRRVRRCRIGRTAQRIVRGAWRTQKRKAVVEKSVSHHQPPKPTARTVRCRKGDNVTLLRMKAVA